ncbi:MAG: microviridin/marinostatin family tricyclic proteinase inhibitor [Nannocystaceae bacterium]
MKKDIENEKKELTQPFFTRYLEGQQTEAEDDSKPMITMKWPSDEDEIGI